MSQRLLVPGNEAVGWGALSAGCDAFFGYPITPQNEIPAFFAKEMPKRGKVFVQSQSETGSINILFGGGAAGARAMTSTSSPGWSLMQEGMSHIAFADVPAVIVLVQRGGPGTGSTRHAQMDYLSATRGAHGGYKTIVLAPASVQENHDLVQLAFHLADKYRGPVVVLTDAIIGQMSEPLEVKTLDFGPLPEKDWALRGKAQHEDGKARNVHSAHGMQHPIYLPQIKKLYEKYRDIEAKEVRYETYREDDASLLLVAFGYVARVSQEAVNMARAEGLKVGLFRPVTLWPFPARPLKERAEKGLRFLVIEDNMGQMVDDVRLAVEGKARVDWLGVFARHLDTPAGLIFPERVLEEVKKIL